MATSPDSTDADLSSVRNPFVLDRVDSAWQDLIDVPAIHEQTYQVCLQSLKLVRDTKQSRGLMLHGEPGTGKTHLLHRVLTHTRTDPQASFVYVPPVTAPERFWRHLLERFFYDLCQGSKETAPGGAPAGLSAGPGQGPLTQIEEMLARHLLNRPLEPIRSIAAGWAEICRRAAPGPALFEHLGPTMDRLAVDLQLDRPVIRALRHYLAWHHRPLAYAYLLGHDLPEEELSALGVAAGLDDEERARQAVRTFCRLATPGFAIILAFDQLESLQLEPQDLQGLQAYARECVNLLSECRNVLLISAVQTYFLDVLRQAVHSAHYDRLAQDLTALPLLFRDTAKRLIEARLRGSEEVQRLRKAAAGDPPALWPFREDDIAAMIPIGGIPARQLIRECRRRFERLQAGGPAPAVSPGSRAQTLEQCWAERYEAALREPIVRLDAGVYEDGLLKLLQAKPPEGWQPRRPRPAERDLHVVLEPGGAADRPGAKLAVSVSASENMTSVARQVGRLQELAGRGDVSKLVLLRDGRVPIKKTAVKTQERLRQLAEAGHAVVTASPELYAALVALRRLWADAAESSLIVDDQPVPLGELQRWLREQTPRPLQELWERCQRLGATPEAAPPERAGPSPDELIEALRGRWICPLSELAARLEHPEPAIERLLAEHAGVAGLLPGPPALVFLHPGAVLRN